MYICAYIYKYMIRSIVDYYHVVFFTYLNSQPRMVTRNLHWNFFWNDHVKNPEGLKWSSWCVQPICEKYESTRIISPIFRIIENQIYVISPIFGDFLKIIQIHARNHPSFSWDRVNLPQPISFPKHLPRFIVEGLGFGRKKKKTLNGPKATQTFRVGFFILINICFP